MPSFSSILNRSGANTIQNTSQLSSMDFPSNLQCIPSKCIYTWSSTFTEHKSFHSSMVWAKSTMQRGTLKKQKKKKRKWDEVTQAMASNWSLPWLHQFGHAWRIGHNQRLRIPTSCQKFRYKVPENTGKYIMTMAYHVNVNTSSRRKSSVYSSGLN